MNYLEINKVLNRMIDKTRIISIKTEVYYIFKGLPIDKNGH